ncbi:response regulator transcription factor [Xanthocytophaga agilis]|uniref:Response regulator transcription factor n=1 Tax=Xanthocytophaga agilis TaxID=3048010 RepID=A0AAE3UJW6_9BACT|nr:response regulator transcription factor [Xanthocytophaga agilis]MDJ1505833.1 response regulator transcription factor [Xanthocytophaga agilis]
MKNSPLRVAIVDDNHSYREGLVFMLQLSEDFECVGEYYSGHEFLQELPRTQPQVVLMDIEMPHMDGITCTQKIKALAAFAHVQVIVLSVLEDNHKILEAIVTGASGYLLKGEKPENILNAIEQVHNGGSFMSAEIARKVLFMVRVSNQSPKEKIELNERETQVLNGLVEGLSYKMIGDKYAMAIDTVRGYIKRIYEKLQVHSRSEAVAKALKNKLV